MDKLGRRQGTFILGALWVLIAAQHRRVFRMGSKEAGMGLVGPALTVSISLLPCRVDAQVSIAL